MSTTVIAINIAIAYTYIIVCIIRPWISVKTLCPLPSHLIMLRMALIFTAKEQVQVQVADLKLESKYCPPKTITGDWGPILE